MLKRWEGFTRFLDDGRICLTNNAAERALCGIALGRKSWLFAGSDRGGERAAAMYTLNRHRQAQRRRPAGLARRCPRPHRRAAAHPGARAPALELESRAASESGRIGRLSPHATSSNPPAPPERTSRTAVLAGWVRHGASVGGRTHFTIHLPWAMLAREVAFDCGWKFSFAPRWMSQQLRGNVDRPVKTVCVHSEMRINASSPVHAVSLRPRHRSGSGSGTLRPVQVRAVP